MDQNEIIKKLYASYLQENIQLRERQAQLEVQLEAVQAELEQLKAEPKAGDEVAQ
ncbi:hypothetical protein [Brevibacterium moorei]|uniref:hypothetical protein n=1 Tax=Brevibacterium moorei TaxID=2968457 RepID=UPI00211BCC27|nr:hypothetical protein [Brevibacterium sp. 68QC2CO]MCQ9385110.1 hypothetical protein [Brevibacterium sp. 68QC2CO]